VLIGYVIGVFSGGYWQGVKKRFSHLRRRRRDDGLGPQHPAGQVHGDLAGQKGGEAAGKT